MVCTLFNQRRSAGSLTPRLVTSGLGGDIDGTLCQYGVFPQHGFIAVPTNLTPTEAGTLSCAPLTAWNALHGLKSKAIKPGQTVLTQGTGGVSISALQFAIAAGAKVIATSSSDEKRAMLKKLGATHNQLQDRAQLGRGRKVAHVRQSWCRPHHRDRWTEYHCAEHESDQDGRSH